MVTRNMVNDTARTDLFSFFSTVISLMVPATTQNLLCQIVVAPDVHIGARNRAHICCASLTFVTPKLLVCPKTALSCQNFIRLNFDAPKVTYSLLA